MLAGCDLAQIYIPVTAVYQDVALEGHIYRGLSWKAQPGINPMAFICDLASVRACNRDAESSWGKYMGCEGTAGTGWWCQGLGEDRGC